MEFTSYTADGMRRAITEALGQARSARTNPTDIFLDALHRRGFVVRPDPSILLIDPPAQPY